MDNKFRHEYKFLISREAAVLLKCRLPHFMRRDSHAGSAGGYTIRSLYFDRPDFRAFRSKVDGVDHRTKYRVRCYNYGFTHLKLEKKEKHGELTRKTAEKILPEQLRILQETPLARMDFAGESLLEELRLLCVGEGLRPAVLVDYDRTPFVCRAGNTRITLDENLRTLPYARDLFAGHHGMIPVMEPGTSVLEVKFDEFLPGYLNEILEDIPKAPMAISKFAMCLNLI